METQTHLQNLLARNIAEVLRQAVDLLKNTDDQIYTQTEKSASADGSAIGAHFRHCLEFVNCFLAGIETGRIDYDRRERNERLENSRQYAIDEFSNTIDFLEKLAVSEKVLLVKPEDISGSSGGGEDFWCRSSIERELDFLQSHTIHHYALIGFKLRAFGFELPPEFGVAPSTLRFWNQQKNRLRKTVVG